MNKQYREGVTKMETAGVDPDYIMGWQGGFLGHPKREQQRASDAYKAGYEDGQEKNADNFVSWVQKH